MVTDGPRCLFVAKCCACMRLCVEISNSFGEDTGVEAGVCAQLAAKAINADTSDYEYEVLADVLTNIVFGPKPVVERMRRHSAAQAADAEPGMRRVLSALPPALRELWRHQQHLFALNRCAAPFCLCGARARHCPTTCHRLGANLRPEQKNPCRPLATLPAEGAASPMPLPSAASDAAVAHSNGGPALSQASSLSASPTKGSHFGHAHSLQAASRRRCDAAAHCTHGQQASLSAQSDSASPCGSFGPLGESIRSWAPAVHTSGLSGALSPDLVAQALSPRSPPNTTHCGRSGRLTLQESLRGDVFGASDEAGHDSSSADTQAVAGAMAAPLHAPPAHAAAPLQPAKSASFSGGASAARVPPPPRLLSRPESFSESHSAAASPRAAEPLLVDARLASALEAGARLLGEDEERQRLRRRRLRERQVRRPCSVCTPAWVQSTL